MLFDWAYYKEESAHRGRSILKLQSEIRHLRNLFHDAEFSVVELRAVLEADESLEKRQ